MMVSLHVEDSPVGYKTPFGPPVKVTVGYNERETLQPANLNYTNFGRQWTHNWNGCIRISTTSCSHRAIRGGGSEDHPINPSNPNFAIFIPKSHSQILRVTPTRWDRLLPDGSKEVYQSLGESRLRKDLEPSGSARSSIRRATRSLYKYD